MTSRMDLRAGEEHGEAVDADAFAGGGREAVAEGADVVLVHVGGFVVAAVLCRSSCASKRPRWSSGSLSSEKALPTSKPPM